LFNPFVWSAGIANRTRLPPVHQGTTIRNGNLPIASRLTTKAGRSKLPQLGTGTVAMQVFLAEHPAKANRTGAELEAMNI
jgi:hypothetical protein